MAKAKKKNISTSSKNWIIGICTIIVLILLALYFYKWHVVKEEEKYLNSYLIETNTISLQMNDISEIAAVLSETPNEYFVYVSYTEDKDIYEFEKKLKPIIKKYAIQNNFYYLNITNLFYSMRVFYYI